MGAITGGTVFAGAVDCSSDLRLKREVNVLSADRVRDLIKLQGVSWKWRREEFPGRNLGNETRFGFIAQDVEEVYPELVRRGEDGFLSLQVGGLEPLLAQGHHLHDERIVQLETDNVALKEDARTHHSLDERIVQLETDNAELKSDNAMLKEKLSKLDVELAGLKEIWLGLQQQNKRRAT